MALNIRPQTSLKRSVSTPGTVLSNWRTIQHNNNVRTTSTLFTFYFILFLFLLLLFLF